MCLPFTACLIRGRWLVPLALLHPLIGRCALLMEQYALTNDDIINLAAHRGPFGCIDDIIVSPFGCILSYTILLLPYNTTI